jgi:hypothetical protein
VRKAAAYRRLVVGVDACKFGKQWFASVKAMQREYGHTQEIAKQKKVFTNGI